MRRWRSLIYYALWLYLPFSVPELREFGGVVALWIGAAHAYLLVKVMLFRAFGWQVRSIYFGLPGPAISEDARFMGIACTYTVLPLFPFVSCIPKRAPMRRTSVGLRLIALALNLLTPFVAVAVAAPLIFWLAGMPRGNSNLQIREISTGSLLRAHGVKEGDKLVQLGSTRITDTAQALSVLKASRGRMIEMLFLGEDRYRDPIFVTIPEHCSNFNECLGAQLRTVPLPKHVFVEEVERNSLADKVGLDTGDEILAVNGHSIRTISELVRIFRSGMTCPVDLTVQRSDDSVEAVRLCAGNGVAALKDIGARITTRIRVAPRPIPIIAVEPNSPASKAGIRPGDLLLEIDGEPVSSSDSLRNKLASKYGRQTSLKLVRNGRAFTLSAMPAVLPSGPMLLGISSSSSNLQPFDPIICIERGIQLVPYSATVPFQLLGQLSAGLVNPYGIYAVWSPVFSWSELSPVQLGVASAVSWRERIKGYVFLVPLLFLALVMPFFVLMEYVDACRRMVLMLRPGIPRMAFSTVLLGLVVATLLLIRATGHHIWVYDIPTFDDFVVLRWSDWRL